MCSIGISNISNIADVSLADIKKDVSGKYPTLPMENEFIRRITLVDDCALQNQAREYFLCDFSSPILKYINAQVYHVHDDEDSRKGEILGEYYIFISKENKNTPYYKLTLYAHIKNSTLRNYVMAITLRHFVNIKAKEDKIERLKISIDGSTSLKTEDSGNDVIENPWFNLLIGNKGDDNEDLISPETYKKIDYVLSKLPERDEKIIKFMVMGDMSGLEAFEELESDLAKTAKTPPSLWTKKQKQNAMALQKGRALEHFAKIVKNEHINF